MKITGLEIIDLRFPTSLTNDGTDAVHKDPDYSAAYVILHTDGGLEGHGFTFTIGRGNEVCAEAIRAFAPLVIGRDVDEVFAHPAAFWRALGHPIVSDARGEVWVLGTAADSRTAALAGLEAPDFALPDLSGVQHRLSELPRPHTRTSSRRSSPTCRARST